MPTDDADARLAELIAGLRSEQARVFISRLPRQARAWLEALAASADPETTLDDIAASGAPKGELEALLREVGAAIMAGTPEVTEAPPRTARVPVTEREQAVESLLATIESSADAIGNTLTRETQRARGAFLALASRLGDDDADALQGRAKALKESLRSLRREQRQALPRLVADVLRPAAKALVDLAAGGPAEGRLYAGLVEAAVAESAFAMGAGGNPAPLWEALFGDALAAGAFPIAERAADRLRGAALDAGDVAQAVAISQALRAQASAPDGDAQVALGATVELVILGVEPASAVGLASSLASQEERATRGLILAIAHRAVERADAALEVLVRVLLAQGPEARRRLMSRLLETRTAFERTFGEPETRRLDRHLGLVRETWGEAGLVAELQAVRAAMSAAATR